MEHFFVATISKVHFEFIYVSFFWCLIPQGYVDPYKIRQKKPAVAPDVVTTKGR